LGLSAGEKSTFENWMRCVNLCHDCISMKDERKKNNLVYNGPSVDEVCLLEMACDTGISHFVGRDADYASIMINGKLEKYEVLKIFEFTSDRKAMSVILKHPAKKNTALCFVKGADSSVFPMCQLYQSTK